MIKALICTAVSVLSLAATNVAAADPKDGGKTQDSATSASQPTTAAPEKKYCVKEALTGSRVDRTVCKTAGEWKIEGFDPLNP